ncbi:MAG TPA: hypothetical protein VJ302_21450 [Blastocatellia bacterium]|nr:hypothetical protein [Blastocatellia bacterium]
MKIGILVGAEQTFPPALIEKINSLRAGVTAEYVKVGSVQIGEPNDYRLIFDRVSHEIPFYRSYLKNAALNGAIVVNNPFWWSADEKFFSHSLAVRLGLTVPKTVLLPQKSYQPGVTDGDLRNLEFPLDWDRIIETVGLPAILKPQAGGGWRDIYQVASKEELWECYDRTGTLVMVLQELIDFDACYRCYCVARKQVLVMPYDSANRCYLPREGHPIAPELEDRMVRDSILINETLGYDLSAIEFAIKDEVVYAVDFTNPVPDAEEWSVTEPYFNWITTRVAEMLVDYAKNAEPIARYHRWNRWLHPELSAELSAAPSAEPPGVAPTRGPQVKSVKKRSPKVSPPASPKVDPVAKSVKSGSPRKASTKKAARESVQTAKSARTSKVAPSFKKK